MLYRISCKFNEETLCKFSFKIKSGASLGLVFTNLVPAQRKTRKEYECLARNALCDSLSLQGVLILQDFVIPGEIS